MMNEVITFINEVGFPIFVAVYCLFRLDKTVKENTSVMLRIAERLDMQNKEVK